MLRRSSSGSEGGGGGTDGRTIDRDISETNRRFLLMKDSSRTRARRPLGLALFGRFLRFCCDCGLLSEGLPRLEMGCGGCEGGATRCSWCSWCSCCFCWDTASKLITLATLGRVLLAEEGRGGLFLSRREVGSFKFSDACPITSNSLSSRPRRVVGRPDGLVAVGTGVVAVTKGSDGVAA